MTYNIRAPILPGKREVVIGFQIKPKQFRNKIKKIFHLDEARKNIDLKSSG